MSPIWYIDQPCDKPANIKTQHCSFKIVTLFTESAAATTKHKTKEKHKGEKKKRKSSQGEKSTKDAEKGGDETVEVKEKRKSVEEPTDAPPVKQKPKTVAVEPVQSTEINISENTGES